MRALTERQEIRAAEELLLSQFEQRAERITGRQLGFRGGSITADVFWHGGLGIWGSINGSAGSSEKETPRYWNAFGTQNPHDHAELSIVCEVNPSHEGASPRVGGLFARGHDEHTYILHTGKIGGGRTGVGQKLFWENWPYRKASVASGKRAVDCAIVADLESPQALFEIARFVKEVERIKSLVS